MNGECDVPARNRNKFERESEYVCCATAMGHFFSALTVKKLRKKVSKKECEK
jgi:hypothetical protein